MDNDKIDITLFKTYIEEAELEQFVPFKKYRVGYKVTSNGYDIYQCIKSVPEGSIHNSRNWIKLKQISNSKQSFQIKNK